MSDTIKCLTIGSKIVINDDWIAGGAGVGSGTIASITDTEFTFHCNNTKDEYRYALKDFVFNYSEVCHIWFVRPTYEHYKKSLRERDKKRGNN